MAKPVKIYTTRWCGDCYRAKRFLEERSVAFVEVDIEQDPTAVELVMRHNDGRRRVPTFEINGSWYGNPHLVRLAEILALESA